MVDRFRRRIGLRARFALLSLGWALAVLGAFIAALTIPPAPEALAEAARTRAIALGVSLGLLGVALSLALLRTVREPISGLIDAARTVASGTLESKVGIPEGGELRALVTAFNEMAASLQSQTHRQQLDAIRDPVTGLPNRTLFMDRLRHVAARAGRRSAGTFAVIFLDVDRFKPLNDRFGHSAGDQLLGELGERLRSCLRDGDTIARLGGDEFGLLLEDLESGTKAVQVAERIKHRLEKPFHLRGREVQVTASMGIAVAPPTGADPDAVLRDADTAMYRAKNSGRGNYQVFDDRMRLEALKTLQVQTALQQGLDRQEFSLAYQPIVCVRTGAVAGFEALARWRYPHGRSVAPAEFIPVAEDTGLIVPIGEWALRESCRQVRRWLAAHPGQAPGWVSVNLSRRQLVRRDLVPTLARLFRETEIDPSRLMLEITESAIMEDPDAAARTLADIRAMGVRVAIDDFGTGYSSLSLLQRFPIDVVKIDRSFVAQVDAASPRGMQVLRAITSLAHNLGLEVVVEGVERAEQAALLTEMGCAYAQGFYFAHPMDAIAITSLLQGGRDVIAAQARDVPVS